MCRLERTWQERRLPCSNGKVGRDGGARLKSVRRNDILQWQDSTFIRPSGNAIFCISDDGKGYAESPTEWGREGGGVAIEAAVAVGSTVSRTFRNRVDRST